MEDLAYVGKIMEINPIADADKIESAVVVCGKGGKWTGVIQKDTHKVGELVEVYLQDSILPKVERFSFLEKNQYRIRIQRLRGSPSECLIMPLTVDAQLGDDISTIIGVDRFIKEPPLNMSGDVYGYFPGFIPKTDERNFQAAIELVQALFGKPFYSSVKADGTSTTAYDRDGHFGVCSRSLEYKEQTSAGMTPIQWSIAREYDLENKIKGMNIAIQWETVGPKIQKNTMRLEKCEPRVFDIYDINKHEYYSPKDMIDMANKLGIPTVDVIELGNNEFRMSEEELRRYAEGKYSSGRNREGVVIRAMDNQRVSGNRLSFKVINPLYKD